MSFMYKVHIVQVQEKFQDREKEVFPRPNRDQNRNIFLDLVQFQDQDRDRPFILHLCIKFIL